MRLLDNALRRIACAAALCIRPADGSNAARVDSPTGFYPISGRIALKAARTLSRCRRVWAAET